VDVERVKREEGFRERGEEERAGKREGELTRQVNIVDGG
jgi:hypothetical protein